MWGMCSSSSVDNLGLCLLRSLARISTKICFWARPVSQKPPVFCSVVKAVAQPLPHQTIKTLTLPQRIKRNELLSDYRPRSSNNLLFSKAWAKVKTCMSRMRACRSDSALTGKETEEEKSGLGQVQVHSIPQRLVSLSPRHNNDQTPSCSG